MAEKGRQGGGAVPRIFVRICAFCLLSAVLRSLYAEDLPDPTRPPASIFMPAVGLAPVDNQSTGLHSVIISKTRRAAIIDGQTVELGAEHGGARLIEVNENGVVLQRAQSRQVLSLFPDVKIVRRTGRDSTGTESSDKESQADQPSSANNPQSHQHITKPTAHKEGK